MKAQELRIGNWIHSPIKSPLMPKPLVGDFQVEAWHLSSMIEFEKVSDMWANVMPIRINLDWLMRFGFTTKTQDKYGNLNFWNKEKDASIDVDLTVSSVQVEPLFYYRVHETIRRKSLRYVHELQNLHFALKGEELTLSEKVKDNQGTE
jgi:hypothetical protein